MTKLLILQLPLSFVYFFDSEEVAVKNLYKGLYWRNAIDSKSYGL